VLPTGTQAWLGKSGGLKGVRESVAIFDDGRVETIGGPSGPRRVALANDEEMTAIARSLSGLPAAPSARAHTPGADLFEYELVWTADGHPIRVLRDDGNLEPELRAFVDAMQRLVPVPDPRTRYAIEPNQSFLAVRTGSGGLLSAFGHDHRLMVRRLSGSVVADLGDLPHSSVTLNVEAGSLAVVDDESQKDRDAIEKEMNDSVLQVARFPGIVFQSQVIEARSSSADVFEIQIEGDLTLHGVTRRIRVPAHLEAHGESLRATGKVRLKQTDYRIAVTSAVGGTVKVADEVELIFDVVALRETARDR
jgi:polyisoprenoid-binding protein YceI